MCVCVCVCVWYVRSLPAMFHLILPYRRNQSVSTNFTSGASKRPSSVSVLHSITSSSSHPSDIIKVSLKSHDATLDFSFMPTQTKKEKTKSASLCVDCMEPSCKWKMTASVSEAQNDHLRDLKQTKAANPNIWDFSSNTLTHHWHSYELLVIKELNTLSACWCIVPS